MKKTIILVAGYPGTGKSYLCNHIIKKEKGFILISQDDIKERLFDEIGYDNLEEKEDIVHKSWEQYYKKIEKEMKEGKLLISDYPFSSKQKPYLDALCSQFAYQVITIRLVADLDILYERQRLRDLDPTRHLSHIVSNYHIGDTLEDRSLGDGLLSHDEFMHRCKTRGYGTFQIGYVFEVDVSDYAKVKYDELLCDVEKLL